MKLRDIHEAKYAFPNYANWVQKNLDNEKDAGLEFDSKDVEIALKQLTRKYGTPHHQQDTVGRHYRQTIDRDYYLWQNDVDENTSYDISLWPWGELLIHAYKETDVD